MSLPPPTPTHNSAPSLHIQCWICRSLKAWPIPTCGAQQLGAGVFGNVVRRHNAQSSLNTTLPLSGLRIGGPLTQGLQKTEHEARKLQADLCEAASRHSIPFTAMQALYFKFNPVNLVKQLISTSPDAIK